MDIDIDKWAGVRDFGLVHSNGIYLPHFSPSTINSFIERRGSFYESKVLRLPFSANPAMARGTAVEHAINVWLETGNESVEDLTDACYQKYDAELTEYLAKAGPVATQEAADLRLSLPKLVRVAFDHYRLKYMMGKPLSQAPVSFNLPGIKRKITGYMDYYRPGKEVTDNKLSARSPGGKLSQGYCIQGSLYRHFTGVDVEFDFIVATKDPRVETVKLSDEDHEFGMSYAISAMKCLEEIEECEDPKRVMALCMAFPNLSALWNTQERVDAAKRYGISLR